MTPPLSLEDAEARLRSVEAAILVPGPHPDVAILRWVDELDALDAFLAGMKEGMATLPGGPADLLALLGLGIAFADLGSLLSWLGLALGWSAVFHGMASGIRAERRRDRVLDLRRRVLDAMTRLARLG